MKVLTLFIPSWQLYDNIFLTAFNGKQVILLVALPSDMISVTLYNLRAIIAPMFQGTISFMQRLTELLQSCYTLMRSVPPLGKQLHSLLLIHRETSLNLDAMATWLCNICW